MAKNILKEIIIILLLTLAVILLLGVLLYDFVPMNKVIPEKVQYVASDEIREVSEEINKQEEEMPINSYTVTSTDLKNYKRVHEYEAGRKNPLSPAEEKTGEANKEETENITSNGNGNTNTKPGKTEQSYWPNKGTK